MIRSDLKLYEPVMVFVNTTVSLNNWQFGYYLGKNCIGIPLGDNTVYNIITINTTVLTLDEFYNIIFV